ncbi:clip-associated protein [Nicotiana attenuata]|uniref:Clip-associated protein n=1 Tax=Nicotiana attenuata TaxID=49451 RepID=A0A1J6IRQ1_NICAT|nr:clip-associated protein [Nicotiana attenuata]
MEGLNNMLKTAHYNGWIKGFNVANNQDERLEITHLQYADDTLIFCGTEESQVKYLRIILILFEAVSGLHINWRKSQIFPVNEVPNIQMLANILGGEIGTTPTIYLGMPLGAKSKSKEIWNGVLERCEKKLARWKTQYISLGGRLVLINSVLDALPTYMMSLFPLPASVENRLETLRRNFLWHGNKEKKGFHLVYWKKLTISKREGGLGIKNLRKQNKCLLMKWLWRFPKEEQTLWGKVIKAKYGKEGFWMTKEVKNPYGISLWRSIRNLWPNLFHDLSLNVRDGRKTLFWEDNWLGIGSLKNLFPDIFTLNQQQGATVKEVWGIEGWNLTFRRLLQGWELTTITEFYNTLEQCGGLQEGEDTLVWQKHSSGRFTVGSAYKNLNRVSSPTIIVERAGSCAWMHKSFKVREEFARTLTSAIGLFASTELPLQRAILPPILHMLNDPNHGVREAAISCIEEMYSEVGPQFRDELQRHHLPSMLLKDINARLEKIEPKSRSTDGISSNYSAGEVRSASLNSKKSSPKAKRSTREASLLGGDSDITEKPVDPIKVYSEKELIREFEKIASTLVPEKDWSIRIAAMQRVEALVIGGAADYPCFRGLLKQLVGPLSTQLSDRRSSIIKQACHLLNFLSKELLGDFEACAEMFIPVLFKLVVITVLVIAESADNCIKTMLRNCKVGRALPRIADSAKNDRNAVLRARCGEYALLILEHWPDASEVQRSAELYEDLIKCCVADAMSEVRSTARTLYRMFARTWPERSRRLFMSFDPAIQRIINEEDGGIHKRHASPSVRERSSQFSLSSQTSASSHLPGYGTSAIVAMDRSANLSSGTSLSSGLLLPQAKPVGVERSLESVLHASKQKVSAIENLLKGLDVSERSRSSSLDLGVDPPSSRDPPFPLAVPASTSLSNASLVDAPFAMTKGNNRNGGLVLSDIITQIQASKDSAKASYRSSTDHESFSALNSYTARRASEKPQDRGLVEENAELRDTRRFMNSRVDRQYLETPYRDANFRDSHNNHVPNFQRPLLKKNAAGRMSASRRRSFDDSQLPLGDVSSYVDGPASLNDALSEGLSSTSDWKARVAAFSYLRSLLQQGPRGIQEITQSFEKVMKLFFQHLDDPHHKVAQAALSTLADLIPACRKPFESYVERILPHVFSRLIDPKELVRQPCSTTLEIVSKTYGIDSLLPALLRSLDEQRSPKAKLAVIEFAIGSFNKHPSNSEGAANIGILKLWLAKLTPLIHDKNTKLKEAAISCIISMYTHFDSTAVLNFILSLSVEEQNSLRRALKKCTPRIEVDLMNFLQSKKDRQRSKSSYDPSDVVGTSSEEGYIGTSTKNNLFGRYSGGAVDSDSIRKWNSLQDPTYMTRSTGQLSDGTQDFYRGVETGSNTDPPVSKAKDLKFGALTTSENNTLWTLESKDNSSNIEQASTPHLDGNELVDNGSSSNLGPNHLKLSALKINSTLETGPSIPHILHLICNGNDGSPSANKRDALEQLVEASVAKDQSIWSKYFNQILTAVLEVLDDSESLTRELALSLILEMLKNQKNAMEDSVEIIIEKLLHVTKDDVAKVANEAESCLTTILSQYDPFRCLSVIVPLLVTEDEKTLVTCINTLTKLVGRLSQEELMSQLPSFLPSLFDAFGNQSADVRKTVVFCLVDIYIMLGKAFMPYLEGLNSTQLRLVTIYANRISQARTGTPVDASHS